MEDEDADDLDYHVTFPSPVSPLPREESGDDEPVELCEEKEPVVILLGWAGCEDKHLLKYSSIYVQKRCITIRYTAPTKDMFYSRGNLFNIAGKILELITDLTLDENPLFFHVFSNGGGFVYRYITELLHHNREYSGMQLKGCIFDSCPGQGKPSTAVRAFMATLNVNIILKYILGFLFVSFMMLKFVVQKLLGLVTVKYKPDTFNVALQNDPSRCPQLFLYSKADKIATYQYVESHMAHRKSLGVEVWSECWDESPHVAHFRHHRESYIKHCYDFLDHCLGNVTGDDLECIE